MIQLMVSHSWPVSMIIQTDIFIKIVLLLLLIIQRTQILGLTENLIIYDILTIVLILNYRKVKLHWIFRGCQLTTSIHKIALSIWNVSKSTIILEYSLVCQVRSMGLLHLWRSSRWNIGCKVCWWNQWRIVFWMFHLWIIYA